MPAPRPAPCGSWKSPITTDLIVAGTITLRTIERDGADLYWIEARPAEGGRNVVVRRAPDGTTADVTPPPFNARTRVHEYGGAAFVADEGAVTFASYADQLLYRIDAGGAPRPLTAPGYRYADASVDRARRRLYAVEEDHTGEGEAANRIVAIGLDDGARAVVAEGCDFFASARLSPRGDELAFIAWNHPDMPWDATELRVVPIDASGRFGPAARVAGAVGAGGTKRRPTDESVVEPRWAPDGTLYFATDRSGFWNIHRRTAGGDEPVGPARALEFSGPHWKFGLRRFDFLSADRAVCAVTDEGVVSLAILDLRTGALDLVETGFNEVGDVHADGAGHAIVEAGSPRMAQAIVRVDLATGAHEVIRSSSDVEVDPAFVAEPISVAFPAEDGATAHGFLYRPTSPDHVVPEGERPPLLVFSHGGPTGSTMISLRLDIQYWTSRGFAVLDVNYGGSTGHGRAYRRRLDGKWGIVDVDDCVAGARWLVERGEADGARLAIRGGSAGGYTTLCALTFRDVFAAGASHYGVSDVEALFRDTHKFESRYGDRLYDVAPSAPEAAALFRARSPIHHTEKLACPLILFQGLEDAVVPPNQAEMMFDAVRAKGLPVAYLAFEGEQHGFRRAETIKRTLEAELYFYGKVFGFAPADAIEPVAIENLPR